MGKKNRLQDSNTEKANCIECSRNVKRKSTFCTVGAHWIHYHCEKLTSKEIQEIENSKPDAEYKCKICSEET